MLTMSTMCQLNWRVFIESVILFEGDFNCDEEGHSMWLSQMTLFGVLWYAIVS